MKECISSIKISKTKENAFSNEKLGSESGLSVWLSRRGCFNGRGCSFMHCYLTSLLFRVLIFFSRNTRQILCFHLRFVIYQYIQSVQIKNLQKLTSYNWCIHIKTKPRCYLEFPWHCLFPVFPIVLPVGGLFVVTQFEIPSWGDPQSIILPFLD